MLETETAQLETQGHGNFSNALQSETSSDDKTYLTETQFEYAVNDRTEILVEPFFYERTTPKGGSTEHGVGDVEMSLVGAIPAVAHRR